MINYSQLVKCVKNKKVLCKTVDYSNKVLTALNYISYPVFLVVAWYSGSQNLIKYILFPAISFVLLSVFRHIYNAPRPYERFDYEPIGRSKENKGKSFPSRHVFSAFVIAFMMLDFYTPLGIVFLILAAMLAVVRVLCGVHYIKDVTVGALVACASYLIMILAF